MGRDGGFGEDPRGGPVRRFWRGFRPPRDGTRGIGDVVGRIAGGVGQFLNLALWYVMKDRSGTVGATGVAEAVRALRASTRPSASISWDTVWAAGWWRPVRRRSVTRRLPLRLPDAARSRVLALRVQPGQRAGAHRILPRRDRKQVVKGPFSVDLFGRGHRRRQRLRHVAARRRQHEGDWRCLGRVRRARPQRAAADH